jgi:ABC-type polar amino acid transport system ATPase subunit
MEGKSNACCRLVVHLPRHPFSFDEDFQSAGEEKQEMDQNNVMIEVQHLNKFFGKLHVLRDISATVTKGEVVSIMGPSGGGKSTFLRCLNRLEEPSSGKVYIEGVDIQDRRINLNELRTEIGMVFQNFALFPHLTAIENIILAPMKVRKAKRDESVERGMRLLRKVGVQEKAESYPDQLSGGQQQRVAIARALAMQPRIMFFDEPTSALDPEMIREVLDVMLSLARDGMTMLVVSHEIGFIREASTRILVLDGGRIIEEGSPQKIFQSPEHERTREFLGKIL